MKKKRTMILIIFFWICTIGIAGTFVLLNTADKHTGKNTSEYMATVEKIDITDTGKNKYIEIFTKEYDIPLYVSTNVGNKIDVSTVEALTHDDTIFFRVENDLYGQLNEIDFLNIVSLKTSDYNIFSLDDYNMFMYESTGPARNVSAVLALLLLILSLVSTIKWLSFYKK